MKTVVEPSVYLLGVICFLFAFGQRLSVSAQDDADADSDGDSLASSFFSGEYHLNLRYPRSFPLLLLKLIGKAIDKRDMKPLYWWKQEVAH